MHYNRWRRNGSPFIIKKEVKRHGLRHTDEYKVWDGIMQRCYNKKCSAYSQYGGRGIKLYGPWHDPETFCRDIVKAIGHRPSGCSIDRIDNNKGYLPDNLRWATKGLQSHNRRFRNKDGLPKNIRIKDNSYEVNVAGKYLGRFRTLDEAVMVKSKAIKEKYGVQEIDC